MANKCGDCLLFQGSGTKCGGGLGGRASGSSACMSFKGPASLFSGKKCGGCRLYQGTGQKCGGGLGSRSSGSSACGGSYTPNPG